MEERMLALETIVSQLAAQVSELNGRVVTLEAKTDEE